MPFISYAQNYEDLILWRALRHIEHGFYIDVGSQDPVKDSVSKAFYERGWRGIHIEPVRYWADLIRQDRPDEVVLEVALGDFNGLLELNVIPDTGLTTALTDYAERHRAERGYEYSLTKVPCLTFDSALEALVKDRDIHWLKIDVEGFERQVLRGWNHRIIRPWVIVVEATIPNSKILDYESWEPLLLEANYHFSYFDGLNRFYVAAEHVELVNDLNYPPCVFDDFKVISLVELEERAEESLKKALAAEIYARETEERFRIYEEKVQTANRQAEIEYGLRIEAESRANSALAQAEYAQSQLGSKPNNLLIF